MVYNELIDFLISGNGDAIIFNNDEILAIYINN